MDGLQRQISIVLKVKGAEEAKKAIQDLVPKGVPEQVKKYGKEVDKVAKNKEMVTKNSKQAAVGIKDFTGKIFASIAVISLFNRGLNTVIQNFERGAAFERASVVFENTVGNIQKMLPELRAATRGTVEDLKLIQTANRAVTEGLDPNKLRGVYQMATVASRRLGLSLTDTIQTISNAINRHDESAMTSLGIIMKNNEAYQVLQSQIGAMGGPINSALKIQARHNFVMAQLAGKYGDFNSVQADSMELLEQVRSGMLNLTRQGAQLTIVAFKPLISMFRTTITLGEHLVKTLSEGNFRPVLQSFALIASSVSVIATGLAAFKILRHLQFGALFTLPSLLGMIGAGLVVSAVGVERIQEGFEKAGLGAKVFIDLLKNYDPNTGLTSALQKDADELGGFYNLVLGLARGFKVVEAVGKGVFQGVISALKGMGGLLGNLGGAFEEVFNAIANNEPVKQSTLDKIQDMVALLSESIAYIYPMYKLFLMVGSAAAGILATVTAIKAIFSGAWIANLLKVTALKVSQSSVLGNIARAGFQIAGLGGAGVAGVATLGYAAYQGSQGLGETADKFREEQRVKELQTLTPVSNSQQEVTDLESVNGDRTMKGILDGINKLVDNSDQDLRKKDQQAIREMVDGFATE
jgi:hypothetical protein